MWPRKTINKIQMLICRVNYFSKQQKLLTMTFINNTNAIKSSISFAFFSIFAAHLCLSPCNFAYLNAKVKTSPAAKKPTDNSHEFAQYLLQEYETDEIGRITMAKLLAERINTNNMKWTAEINLGMALIGRNRKEHLCG